MTPEFLRLKLPLADVVFSAKTFIAALLALFIALEFDLQNPFWAVTTVYVVSNPLSGASTSKAFYRLLGTVAGGLATVVLVPNLVNAPELLTVAISLWIALCLAISLIDRSPRGYAFMLAGYTTALTGFPIVTTPEVAFTYVTARMIEISVGIVAAAIISRLVFPRPVGPVLSARIESWLRDSRSLIVNALRNGADDELNTRLMRLAAEAVELRSFTAHTTFDTSAHRDVVPVAKALQRRMVEMLPIISAVSEGLQELRQSPDHIIAADLEQSVQNVCEMLRDDSFALGVGHDEQFVQITAEIDIVSNGLDPHAALELYVSARLKDLVQIWSDCELLKDDIVSGRRHPLRWERFDGHPKDWPGHRDYRMAMHSGLAAMAATCLSSWFWIASGWSQGGAATMMAAVLCCIFSSLDDPTPAMFNFLKGSVIALFGSFVLVFGVLPFVDGFAPLTAALGLLLIPAGILIAKPSTAVQGLAFCMMLPAMITLQGRLEQNFESFINANVAIIIGFSFACLSTAVVRSVSAEWSARRLLRASLTDLAQTSEAGDARDFEELPHRMVDRAGLIAPRLAVLGIDHKLPWRDMVKDLRDAFNLAELQRHSKALSQPQRQMTLEVRAQVAKRFDRLGHDPALTDDPELVSKLEELIGLLPVDQSGVVGTRLALTGLLHNLTPHAFAPTVPANDYRAVPGSGEAAA